MKNISTLVGVVLVAVVALWGLQWLSQPQGYYNDGEVDLDGTNVVTGVLDREPDRAARVDPRGGSGYTSEPMDGAGNINLIGGSLQGQLSMDESPAIQQLRAASCFPKEQLMPAELLPQDNSSLWAQVNPQGVGTLKDRNFLQACNNIGINTVGSTMRNANLQVRSEPPCPQVPVSPWLNSTIEPDTNRKPLEIGGCL